MSMTLQAVEQVTIKEELIKEIISLRKGLGWTQETASRNFGEQGLFNRIEAPCFRGPNPKYKHGMSNHKVERVIRFLKEEMGNKASGDASKFDKIMKHVNDNFESEEISSGTLKGFTASILGEAKDLGVLFEPELNKEEMADYFLTLSEAVRKFGY